MKSFRVYLTSEEIDAGWVLGPAAIESQINALAPRGWKKPNVDVGVVDLNRATAAELRTLPGIGPARATDIVRWRDIHGPLVDPRALLAINGIGERTLNALSPLIACMPPV